MPLKPVNVMGPGESQVRILPGALERADGVQVMNFYSLPFSKAADTRKDEDVGKTPFDSGRKVWRDAVKS